MPVRRGGDWAAAPIQNESWIEGAGTSQPSPGPLSTFIHSIFVLHICTSVATYIFLTIFVCILQVNDKLQNMLPPVAPVLRDPAARNLLEQRGFEDIDMPDIRYFVAKLRKLILCD